MSDVFIDDVDDASTSSMVNNGGEGGGCIVDIMDSDEEDLAMAHSALGHSGIIDLTEHL